MVLVLDGSVYRLYNKPLGGSRVAWATLVSRFATVLHCYTDTDSAASRAASTCCESMSPLLFVQSTSLFCSPSVLQVVSSSTLAAILSTMPNTSRPHPKAIFWFCISRASIGVFFGMYMSLSSVLMCFHRLGFLAITISCPTGKFYFLGLH